VSAVTVPRAVLEQALEALFEIHWSNDSRWQADRAGTVIPALRAALAQPDVHPQCAQGCEFLAMEQRRNEREEWLKERGFE
jgi:hypothetical protein